MRRLLFAGMLILTGTGVVRAQQLSLVINDSVLALRPGDSATVDIGLITAYHGYPYYQYGGLAYDSLTLLFDDTQVHFAGAKAVAGNYLPDPNVIVGSGQVVLASTSTTLNYSCCYTVARVLFKLDPAAVVGSIVTLQADSLSEWYLGVPFTAAPTAIRICHASKLWGDLDGDQALSSRDALITLSDAVGLSVTGFDTTVADVDRDGLITSRDALFILSAALGISTSSSDVGMPIPDVCPAAPAPPIRTGSTRSQAVSVRVSPIFRSRNAATGAEGARP